jgi:Uncharacterized membrane protein, required for spore maturation in B.subtilis.
MLNGLWLGFFLVAAVSALAQWLVGGNAGIFAAMVESIFAMAKLSVEVMVLLFGTLTLWLGSSRSPKRPASSNGWPRCSGRCSPA